MLWAGLSPCSRPSPCGRGRVRSAEPGRPLDLRGPRLGGIAQGIQGQAFSAGRCYAGQLSVARTWQNLKFIQLLCRLCQRRVLGWAWLCREDHSHASLTALGNLPWANFSYIQLSPSWACFYFQLRVIRSISLLTVCNVILLLFVNVLLLSFKGSSYGYFCCFIICQMCL